MIRFHIDNPKKIGKMKKIYILTTVLCSISLMIYGQGETDALRFSQLDMRGTARYMSMAGAFGALG